MITKYQRPLSQCVSQILSRHALLDACASVIIGVNTAPVRYLYRFSVFHYGAIKFCSRIFVRVRPLLLISIL